MSQCPSLALPNTFLRFIFFAKRQGSCVFKKVTSLVKTRTDIRIRIRHRVIRIRVSEARIRTIIRITGAQHTTSDTIHLYFFTPRDARVQNSQDANRNTHS